MRGPHSASVDLVLGQRRSSLEVFGGEGPRVDVPLEGRGSPAFAPAAARLVGVSGHQGARTRTRCQQSPTVFLRAPMAHLQGAIALELGKPITADNQLRCL